MRTFGERYRYCARTNSGVCWVAVLSGGSLVLDVNEEEGASSECSVASLSSILRGTLEYLISDHEWQL